MSSDASSPTPASNFVALTTVPVSALGQPLVDFLAANAIAAFVSDDDTHLDATRPVEVMVPEKDLARAQALLADYWAENEGPRDAM